MTRKRQAVLFFIHSFIYIRQLGPYQKNIILIIILKIILHYSVTPPITHSLFQAQHSPFPQIFSTICQHPPGLPSRTILDRTKITSAQLFSLLVIFLSFLFWVMRYMTYRLNCHLSSARYYSIIT